MEAIKELQANQIGVVAAVKEFQDNMIATAKQLQGNMDATFKPTTLVNRQGASATQERHTPKWNNESFLTQAVMELLEKELHKPFIEDLKYVPQPPYPLEVFQKLYPLDYEAHVSPCSMEEKATQKSTSIDS